MYLGKVVLYFNMPKVNRYRIYPTKSQVTKLNSTLELCRWIYNETLALRKNAWESEQRKSVITIPKMNLSGRKINQNLKTFIHTLFKM